MKVSKGDPIGPQKTTIQLKPAPNSADREEEEVINETKFDEEDDSDTFGLARNLQKIETEALLEENHSTQSEEESKEDVEPKPPVVKELTISEVFQQRCEQFKVEQFTAMTPKDKEEYNDPQSLSQFGQQIYLNMRK